MVIVIIFLIAITIIGKAFAAFGTISNIEDIKLREKVAVFIPYLIMGVVPSTAFFLLLMGKESYETLRDKSMFWVLSIGGAIIHLGAVVLFYLTFLI